jgi:hypothetical protein
MDGPFKRILLAKDSDSPPMSPDLLNGTKAKIVRPKPPNVLHLSSKLLMVLILRQDSQIVHARQQLTQIMTCVQ